MSQQAARTYERMAVTQPVLEQVIAGLGLNTRPDDLAKRIRPGMVRDTVLIQITAEDRDPKVAQRIANAVAQTFIEQNRRLATGTLTSQKETLARQIAKLSAEIDANILAVERLRTLVVGGQGTAQDTDTPEPAADRPRPDAGHLLDDAQEHARGRDDRVAPPARRCVSSSRRSNRSSRAKPNVSLNILAGFLVGLVGSIGLAALLQYADDTVKASEDTSRAAGCRCGRGRWGSSKAPRSTRSKDLVTVETPRSAVSESHRTVRTNGAVLVARRAGG